MTDTYKDTIIKAFRAAMNAHDDVTGLSTDEPDDVRLWHLLRSAIEFCDSVAPRLDFDLTLEEVREDLRASGDCPAPRAAA